MLALILEMQGSIGFIRIYLGVCSINQVFYAWTLGIWLAAFFRFNVRDSTIKHIEDLVKGQQVLSLPLWKYGLTVTCVVIFLIIIQVVAYDIIEPRRTEISEF